MPSMNSRRGGGNLRLISSRGAFIASRMDPPIYPIPFEPPSPPSGFAQSMKRSVLAAPGGRALLGRLLGLRCDRMLPANQTGTTPEIAPALVRFTEG